MAGLALALAAALLLAGCAARAPAETAPAPAEDTAGQQPEPVRLACPPRQARVRLNLVDPEPALGRDLDIDALHARTGRRRSATSHHLALTTSRVEWLSEVEVIYTRRPRPIPGAPDRYCAVPGAVTLTLVHAEHRTRIAREIPEGSCLDAEVLAHEGRHVAVNRAALREAVRRARPAAEAWARTAEGRGATLDEAKAALSQGLRRAMEPALAEMRSAQDRGHRAIDTAEEYRRLARICPQDQAALRGPRPGAPGTAAPAPPQRAAAAAAAAAPPAD